MLFAAYPAPTGYTPQPPKRKASPLVIGLGICGGCAALVIIGIVAISAFGFNKFKPFALRVAATGQFLAAIQQHKYSVAEAQMSPEAQQSFPADKLQQTEEAQEQKYGALKTFVQSDVDMGNQTDLNSLSKLSYKLHYQNGTSTITLHFEGPQGQNNKITEVEWDTSDSGKNEKSGSGHKKSSSMGTDTGQ